MACRKIVLGEYVFGVGNVCVGPTFPYITGKESGISTEISNLYMHFPYPSPSQSSDRLTAVSQSSCAHVRGLVL